MLTKPTFRAQQGQWRFADWAPLGYFRTLSL
jgi:hypothetical protein